MALYGYARVSSSGQDFALQEQALRAAGCNVVRAEKASGTSRVGRTELEALLDFLRRGDTLVVTRIDRLAVWPSHDCGLQSPHRGTFTNQNNSLA